MDDCIFCRIAKKEIEAYIIKESDKFLAFLDIHPHSPGHSLVISKEHFVNLLELPDNYGNEFLQVVKEVSTLLGKAFETDSLTIGINNGVLAGQAVLHLHLHLIPRFKNDGGGSIHSVVFNKPKESLEEIYLKIKNASQS